MKSPLPVRHGVGASRHGLPPGQWPNLFAYLLQRFPGVAEAEWRHRFLNGLVCDETGQALTLNSPYQAGRVVFYYRDLPAEPVIPFAAHILFEDDHLLVADKPHFLPVTPAGRFLSETLLTRLRRETGIDDLVPLHRIDRETAGLVLFSKRSESREQYSALFRERRINKVYEVIAPLNPRLSFPLRYCSHLQAGTPFFRMETGDGVANSETFIELLMDQSGWGHFLVRPITGRKHQIRVHFATLGMPILFDAIYPIVWPEVEADQITYDRPLQLLASQLSFDDPLTGASRSFKSERQLLPLSDPLLADIK
jgi:tRNA pseudouridine32 synthase/23S rRNA pseudouridine746 synthase